MSQDQHQALARADRNAQAALTPSADPRGIVIPDSVGLLTAEFSRRGVDLAIGSPEAPALVILDYFVAEAPADLVTSGGAVVPGRVVGALAGPDAGGAVLPAAGNDAQPIGRVEQLSGEVVITHADGTRVIAGEGTQLYQDDVVTTDGHGAVGIRFIDGMTLSLGSGARMVLDEFAYDPAADTGGGVIDIIQGAFSFVSGKAAHVGLDSLVIDTPTMTIGIRGTKVVANAAAEGETTTVALLPEDDGTLGKIMISTDVGQQLLEDAFVATTVTSRLLPPAPPTLVAPEWIYAKFSLPLSFLPPELPGDEQLAPQRTDRTELADPDRPQEDALLDEQPAPREWQAERHAGTTPESTPEPLSAPQPQGDRSAAMTDDGAPLDARAPDALLDRASPPLVPSGGPPDDSPGGGGNQAPTAVVGLSPAAASQGGSFTYDVSTSFADPDGNGGDTLTFGATSGGGAPLPAWLAIDAATGRLYGTPSNGDVGAVEIEVTATDRAGASATSSFRLTVTNTNDAPVVVTPIADTLGAEDLAFSYDASPSFADDDAIHGDHLTFSGSLSGGAPLPAWLALDPATGVLSGTPLNADVGLLTVAVTATDGTGASATSSFQLTVGNTNDAPVVVTPLADAAGSEDLAFSYDLLASFTDVDGIHGDRLTFSASLSGGAPLPAWLALDPATGVLSGTPLNGDVGLLTVDVAATDGVGASATSSFQLTVGNTNDAPVVVTPIADAAGSEDLAFSYDVSASFADADAIHGDSLTFSATLSGGAPLPAWLAIDPATGVLSGTPLNADVGLLTVDVTATDGAGASATSSFQLTVGNTNDAPVVVAPIPDVSANLLSLFTYDTSTAFTDVDLVNGDTLTYSAQLTGLLPLPAWLSIDPATGVLSGTPGLLDLVLPIAVEVTATDAAGASAMTSFQVSTGILNDAPVLNVTPTPTLTPLVANGANPGNTVAAIVVDGSITDPDGPAVEAIALTGVDAGNGSWEYSLDGGTSWNLVGAVSDSAALLLDGSAMLRFVPDPGFAGSASLSFRAWDMTSGASGDAGVDASVNGGTTAFSSASELARISVSSGSPDLATGAELQANSTTAHEQESPAVAALAAGGFVTVWQSKDQDGDNWGVYGQRLDASGNAVGAEFQVSAYTTKEQQSPSVAALADGGFVVTWQSKDQDGDNWGVYGQRFDASGNAVGAEFQVNSYATKEQQSPSVAALADGGFVVTWQSKDQDGDNWGVYGQRYDAAGNTVGAEFQVNSTTAKEQQSPSVAAVADGGFVVTWQSKDQDGDNWGVCGQRYDAAGNTVGAELQVNSTTAKEQQSPSVAALADGGFVVTWQSWDQDGHEWGIYGQRFDAAGNPVELEFQVNTAFSKHQQDPSVVGLADGGFLVTWQSKDQDGDNWAVFGQQFDADGDAIGTEFQVNTTATGAQTEPALAASSDGALFGAWTSPDADKTGVAGHLYQSETASVTVNPPSVAATSMLDFGGTSSYVDAGDPGLSANALDPGIRDFTAEAWFYYAGPGGTQTILAKGNASELDAGFSIFLSGSELVVRVTTEFGVDAAASSVTMPATQGWYHVAMVIDQEAGIGASQVSGYLNGSSAGWTPGYGAVPGETFSSLSGGIDSSDSFMIGAVESGGTVSAHFDAQIADVRLWNTARSLSEIQADLGRALNGDEDHHLIANWQLDEGLGGTAQDAAPGAYDGALNGGPAWQPTDHLTVTRDGALAGRISATDPEGDPLSYSVDTGPSNGTAAIDPQTGAWSYNPNAGYTGTDSVSYQVSDGHGGSATVNVAITITP